jgi:uncharacterized membrane protein YGL010W
VLLFILIFSYLIQQVSHKYFEGPRHPSLREEFYVFPSTPVWVVVEFFYRTLGYRKLELEEAKKFIEYDMQQYNLAKNK